MKAADDLNQITEIEDPVDGKTVVETYYGDENEESQLPATTNESEDEDTDDEEFNQDVDTARENLREIIETGNDALGEMQRIGQSTDHPRAYEVLSTMMRTLVDANKSFVDISEKKRSKKKKQSNGEGEESGGVTNNTVFVGNPQDAIDMINKSRRK